MVGGSMKRAPSRSFPPHLLALALPVAAGCGDRPAEPTKTAADEHGHGHAHGNGHGHGPLVHRFQNAAEWAKDFDDPARDAWQKPAEVIAAMRLAEGMIVAEVGAGTGYFLPHLSRAVGPRGRVLALDIEPDMVRYMRERAAREGLANVEPKVVALDDPGLAPGSVDRVLVVDTWHHVDARAAYAAKLRAALRPGGAVYIVDFTKDSGRGPPPHHRLAAEEVARELTAAGLAAEGIAETLPDQYIVVGRRP
jgi:predicted methyltransferase